MLALLSRFRSRHAERNASALLDLRRRRPKHLLIASDSTLLDPIAIIEGSMAVRSRDPLPALIDRLCSEELTFADSQGTVHEEWPTPPRHFEPFDRLCWLLGEQLGRTRGLAPWLDPAKPYFLLAWPDFAQIGRHPQGAALCERLSASSATPDEAARELGLSAAAAAGAFNALSLCGAVHEERRHARRSA
jgi:hypothetical protein